jgi:hypothetical protein
MKNQLKALATLVLVSALSAGLAQTTATGATSTASTTRKRPATKKAVAPKKPSVESQIESLREDMQTQIQQLKQQLSDRDQQLQQAQQSAAAAQAAAAQAQQQAAQQSATLTENTQAVSNLQGAVSDLKSSNVSLATTVQDQQAKVEKEIGSPDAIHYKGITLSPTGSYLAGETVYRNRATGSDIATPFSAIPLENSDAARLTEFYGTGRQSRIALLAEGKPSDDLAVRGYYEADWLGVGVTSNNNESNSYVMRERQLWAQAQWGSLYFTGGQQWSLATENGRGILNRTELTPQTIDPNYVPGFVWERQYGFRVVKSFNDKLWAAVSLENPQTLALGGTLPSNIVVLLGSAGNNGGAYNGSGAPGASSSANVANYSFNLAPDIIAKVAADSPFGHYEVFGIARFFRDRIYPNGAATKPSSAGAYNSSEVGGGIGGSMRVPVFAKHLDLGVKGLWGDGISRYGDTTLADATLEPNGQLALLHGFSALATAEWHATPRLDLYFNYGGDGVFRRYFLTSPTAAVGYGSYTYNNTGCGNEPVPGTTPTNTFSPATPSSCAANTKDVQEGTVGYWYDFYRGPAGRLRQGVQYAYTVRNIWSGIGATPKGTDAMLFTSFRYYLP